MPSLQADFLRPGKHTIITCEMLNKFTGEGISGMGAVFGWACGLKLTEPLPKHEIRHIVLSVHKPN